VVGCCAANRMDDDNDLCAVRQKLFEGRPVEDKHGSRTWLTDTRVMLCHAVAMPFQLLLLLHTAPQQSAVRSVPPKFVDKCFTSVRDRILTVFRQNMTCPLAGRWPGVRVAFATLVAAGDKGPMPVELAHWLRDELFQWRDFILEHFLAASNYSFKQDRGQHQLFNFDAFLAMDYSFGKEVRLASQPIPKALPQIHSPGASVKPELPPMSDSVLGGSRIGPYATNQQLRSEVQKRIDAATMPKPAIGKEWILDDGRVVDALGGPAKPQVLGRTLWEGLPQNSRKAPGTKLGFFHKPAEQTYVS